MLARSSDTRSPCLSRHASAMTWWSLIVGSNISSWNSRQSFPCMAAPCSKCIEGKQIGTPLPGRRRSCGGAGHCCSAMETCTVIMTSSVACGTAESMACWSDEPRSELPGSFGRKRRCDSFCSNIVPEEGPEPWVPSLDVRFEMLLDHARRFEAACGQGQFRRMRKHLGWYCKGFPHAASLRADMFRVSSVADSGAGARRFSHAQR